MGALFGWLVTINCAARVPARAMIALRPSFSPRTSPTTAPSARLAKAFVRFVPPTVTLRPFVELTPPMRTSASPPLTRSARPDSTEIVTGPVAAPAGAAPAKRARARAAPVTIAAQRVVRTSNFML